jgi:hypothetical protein
MAKPTMKIKDLAPKGAVKGGSRTNGDERQHDACARREADCPS